MVMNMVIGGLQRFSLIDYPGKVCAIIFTQGCNFRCHYCHNPELVNPELFQEPIPETQILLFLKGRIKKLDAVTITGGEPLLQPDLKDFLKKIKNLGYLIKLDTNGTFPEKLGQIIESNLLDYVAMDVKAPLDKYKLVAGKKIDKNKILSSISIIMNSNLNYEFRTTILKSLLKASDIYKIGKLIKGAKLYVLQKFVDSKILNPGLNKATFSDEEIEDIRKMLKNYVEYCIVR